MPAVKTDLEARLWRALRRILAYEAPDRLSRNAGKQYGLDGAEAVEMAYENMQQEARNALRGVRGPKPAAAPAPRSTESANVHP
jgi:hypothetical protein